MSIGLPDRARSACESAARYLVGRQSPDGGFCFYQTEHVEEPNLSDTYHAVRALALLGHEIPRRTELIRFLHCFPESGQPDYLYHYALTMRTLDSEFRIGEGLRRRIRTLHIAPLRDDLSGLTGWLERTRTITRLKRQLGEFGEASAVSRAVAGQQRSGGFGLRPNVWDTWLALDILRCCAEAVDLSATAAFVDRLQADPFGFSAIEDAISFNLDVVFAGLRCCAALGLAVKYGAAALSVVLACQSGKGGFSRAPDALPDIELTYRAIWSILRLTAELAQRNAPQQGKQDG